jgi:hypothetical protein
MAQGLKSRQTIKQQPSRGAGKARRGGSGVNKARGRAQGLVPSRKANVQQPAGGSA